MSQLKTESDDSTLLLTSSDGKSSKNEPNVPANSSVLCVAPSDSSSSDAKHRKPPNVQAKSSASCVKPSDSSSSDEKSSKKESSKSVDNSSDSENETSCNTGCSVYLKCLLPKFVKEIFMRRS